MPAVISDDVPVRFAAGTTVKFHRSFDDFLASDGWTYKFCANGAIDTFSVDGTTNADGGSFDVVIPATLTADKAPGRYQCAEVLKKQSTGEVVHPSNDMLQLVIEANVESASAGAFISHIERTLAIIEAAIEGRLTADIENYNVAGRQVAKIPARDLLWFRGHYRAKLFQLKNPGRLGSPVVVAFTNEPEEPTFPPTWVDVTGLDQ
jgi:hypothetical protein